MRTDENFVVAARQLDRDEFVSGKKTDRDLSAFADGIEFGKRGLLDEPELRSHHDVAAFIFAVLFR